MIINVGASAGNVGFCEKDFWSSDGCYCIDHSEDYNDKFLYYFLQTKEHELKKKVRFAGIPTLDSYIIEKIRIPVISIKEQTRIVKLLDEYDLANKTIIQELAKEIKLRKTEYEYYRNLLLDFPEQKVSA